MVVRFIEPDQYGDVCNPVPIRTRLPCVHGLRFLKGQVEMKLSQVPSHLRAGILQTHILSGSSTQRFVQLQISDQKV